MRADQKAVFFDLHGKLVRITIFPHEEQDADLVEVKSEIAQKTQSQRIRACVFKIWQTHGSKGDFEVFYRKKTERIIEWLKQQIEE